LSVESNQAITLVWFNLVLPRFEIG